MTTKSDTKTSLTITMDNNNKVNVSPNNNNMNKKRKESWDSKVSVSTVSTRVLTRADTPSSILSSDSDIRFTRKLGRQYRCGCCILASFIAFLLIIALGLYVGYTLVGGERNADLVFHGSFRVTRGDSFTPSLADPSTRQFFLRARDYRERLNLIFRRSRLRPGFIGTDILAFDGVDKEELVVHFAARFDPRHSGAVLSSDLVRALHSVVRNDSIGSVALAGLSVDPASVDVHAEDGNSSNHRKGPPAATTLSPAPPSPAPPPRRCTPLELDYCRQLPYNITSYPNVIGHVDIDDLNRDVIAFRELVDAECYRHAYEFVCRVLQPACWPRGANQTDDGMVPPCRDFCDEFWEGCGGRIPPRFRERLRCSALPNWAGQGSCLRRPETSCVEELHRRAGADADMPSRVCDGVADCADGADEAGCRYCPAGRIQCGTGPVCIAEHEVCDGTPNCPGGVDEKICLSLAPSSGREPDSQSQLIPSHRFSEGLVLFTERGVKGKLCTENLNRTVPPPNREAALNGIASWICSLMTYQKADEVRVRVDEEDTDSYVHMEDPSASDITFVHAPCPTKEILHVSCSNLECGVKSVGDSTRRPSKSLNPGDWPWHVALFKNDVHVCDGTLIDPSWLITSSSCFQGQDDDNWVARFGTVRLLSTPPSQQTRRLSRRVESPNKNRSLTLAQLDHAVALSDFVRPVCLPEATDGKTLDETCLSLHWSLNKDALESSGIEIATNERCENITISVPAGICTVEKSTNQDCNEEAGTPLMCLTRNKTRWGLVGIRHFTSTCRKTSDEMNVFYERVSSSLDWIKTTVSNSSNQTTSRSATS